MRLPTNLVAVKKITSSVARSSFSVEKLEKFAHLILGVEGTINPILLRRTSLESYEVVDGHFEYYAALRAREISPLKGEMIQAIILEPENEKVLLEQVEILRKGVNSKPSLEENNHDLESKFSNLEKVFQLQFEELRRDNRNLERSIAAIASKGQSSKVGAEVISEIATKVIEAVHQLVPTKRSSEKPSKKRSFDDLKQNPLDLNSASQADLLTIPEIQAKRALDIVERRERQGEFTTIQELFEIKSMKNINRKSQLHECFVIRSVSI